ncbi:putative NBD/HSP70 family sugar kinase [Edaphobacter aggregans]|uniref:Putative NBD/HSP70 family sugar kinase n=1 Tax=Edaphobacter aggregans TaxID=570835 RepID=A0A3R9QH49_9BACT|nr:ROK family protein [Edaphobacter aggregans]RSL16465.1 putative NBD/HSP70 family sugar kinase [Edaphobacter aggregans]
MSKTIGVTLSDGIVAGLVVDHKLEGGLRRFPENEEDRDALVELHTDALVETICKEVVLAANGHKDLDAVGIAVPGLIKSGVVEEAPNLPQLKGARLRDLVASQLRSHDINTPVLVMNDADGMAAGLASVHGKLDSMIRVWTLGVGIGHGRYPFTKGVWEGGHSVVTLDDKEQFCGCGGRGHMEGIMGHRAMRLRFLDMEPEEVFEEAKKGDARCVEFKRLWHKALAAATATSIHMAGPGKFFLTGFNARFLDMPMLRDYMQQMVKMSPLQSYSLEIVEDNPEVRVIGAAVSAEQAAGI